MWKCKIHSEFIEETLLRKFILHEVAIAYDDSHNACILPPPIQVYRSFVWDIQNIMEYFSNRIYSAIFGSYFSNIHDRKN